MNSDKNIFEVFEKMEHGTAFDYRLNNERISVLLKNGRNFEELVAIATDFLMQISMLRATCEHQPPHITIKDPVIPWKCGCNKPGCGHCGTPEQKPEKPETCVWKTIEAYARLECSGRTAHIGGPADKLPRLCPFCGKRVEVRG